MTLAGWGSLQWGSEWGLDSGALSISGNVTATFGASSSVTLTAFTSGNGKFVAVAGGSTAAADGNRQILISNLTTLVSGMSSQVTQAQADLVTISGSTDLLAPVIGRNIQGSLDLAQGVSDILSLLNILG